MAKVKREDGSHDQEAGWLITRRGFECLQNKPVPNSVITFRNRIEERSSDLTTMSEVYQSYKKKDHDDDIKKYSASSWYNVESYFPNDFTFTDEVEE